MLLVVAVAVGLTQSEKALDEGTPERAVQLYLKALQADDFKGAYALLSSEVKGYCLLETFARAGDRGKSQLDRSRVTLKDTKDLDGSVMVTAEMSEISSGGLFGTEEHSFTQSFTLRQEEGEWRLTANLWPFFGCQKPPVEPARQPSPGV